MPFYSDILYHNFSSLFFIQLEGQTPHGSVPETQGQNLQSETGGLRYVMGTSVSTFFILKLTEFTNHYFKKSNFHWSVAKSNLSLRNSMKCSTPGFPVLHYLLEFAQTQVRWVRDDIQPSHLVAPFSSRLQFVFCVHLWRIHADVWQNQYNIVK